MSHRAAAHVLTLLVLSACGSGGPGTNAQPLSQCLSGGGSLGEVWSADNRHGAITALALSADGTVALASEDGSIKTWSLSARSLSWSSTQAGELYQGVTEAGPVSEALAFSPDGTAIIAGTEKGRLALRSAAGLAELESWALSDEPIRAVATTGGLVAAADGSFAGNISLWPTGGPAHRIQLSDTQLWGVTRLTFTDQGRTLLVAGDWYGVPAFEIWDLDHPEGPRAHWRDMSDGAIASNGSVTAFARTGPGDRIVVGGQELVAVLAADRIEDGTLLRMKAEGHTVRSLALTPDDAFVLTAGEAGTLRTWNLRDGADSGSFSIAPKSHIGITADGRWLVAAGADGWLRVLGCDG